MIPKSPVCSRLVFQALTCLALVSFSLWGGESGWRSAGPFGASVESVVFSGKDDRNLLAITRNAFLYKSTDGGDRWALVRFPAQHIALAHSLTLDPNRAGGFLVGVSSANSHFAGLYQTRDNGETWIHTLKGLAVFSAAYSPSDPKLIAAGARDGVYLSRDAGESWQRISPAANKELQPVMSLGFDPRNPSVLYAGTPHLPWKTSDGGATWTSIHHGMIDDSDILALTVNQKKPEQLFIGACSGIYRSDNAAGRWTKLLGITGAGFRTYSVSLDPGQDGVVYSGTKDGLWRSKDLGKSWQKLAPNVIKATAVAPNDSRILFLATEDAGILRSRNGGETFEDASEGLVDRRMVRLAMPGAQSLFVTLGLDGSTLRTSVADLVSETPLPWRRVALPAALKNTSTEFAAVPGEAAGGIYAYNPAGFWRSDDNGASWKALPAVPAAASGGFGVSQVPLAASAKTVYRFAGKSGSWSPATSLGASVGAIRKLWTTHSGRGPAWLEAGNSVWVSRDAGHTWSIGSLPVRGSELYELEAVGERVWAATARGLFRSLDQGMTWKLCDKGIDGGSTTPAVAVDPANPLIAFAAQFGRIFHTRNGGDSWSELATSGLQGATIAALSLASPEAGGGRPARLIALTSARGVFTSDFNRGSEASGINPAPTGNGTLSKD
jgi:photosystem II stability/assembly factor-like uncharacterized protein